MAFGVASALNPAQAGLVKKGKNGLPVPDTKGLGLKKAARQKPAAKPSPPPNAESPSTAGTSLLSGIMQNLQSGAQGGPVSLPGGLKPGGL